MEFSTDTFRALSSPTRLRIIKSLKQRRKTQSEISTELRMHVSTVKEHLDKLEKAGLVSPQDEGRKWKYYSLTESAKRLLWSAEISIVLPAGILFMLAGLSMGAAKEVLRAPTPLSIIQESGDSLLPGAYPASTGINGAVVKSPDYTAYFLISAGIILLAYEIYRIILRRSKARASA